MPNIDPEPSDPAPTQSDDPFTTGDEMLERAKKLARRIEDRVRELTDDTKPEQKALDPTDEEPPLP